MTNVLAELRAALAKATPPPWTMDDDAEEYGNHRVSGGGDSVIYDEGCENTHANHGLIVLLRNNAQALLDLAERGVCPTCHSQDAERPNVKLETRPCSDPFHAARDSLIRKGQEER